MSSPLLVLDCPECASPCAFEEPPCGDGHAPCPEVVCVECGTALVLAGPPADPSYEVVLARTA